MSKPMKLISVLFRSKREVDIYPAIRGRMKAPTPARRNRTGEAEVSKTIAKAVLGALRGSIVDASIEHAPDGDTVVRIHTPHRKGVYESAIHYGNAGVPGGTDWHIKGIYAPDGLRYVATYHIPMVAMAEALARPDEAEDLLDAYLDLLIYYHSVGRAPFDLLEADTSFRDLVLRTADELYYWLRYQDRDPTPDNDRIGVDGEVETGFSGDIASQRDSHISADPFVDADVLSSTWTRGAAASPLVSGEVWPHVSGSFVGPQLGQIVYALQRGRNVLAVGPTGTGKTHAISEALKYLGMGYELITGMDGLLDIDFLGAIVPKDGGDRVWVDGPLARAFRRAAGQPIVLWLDEATRMPTRHMNVLIGAMNAQSMQDLALRGIWPEGISPSESYYTIEVPGTSEILSCPSENLTYVLSANLGRQYAVYGFDPALERRCDYQIDFDYLAEEEERDMVARRIGQPALAVIPRVVTSVAARVREQHANAQLAGCLDTGSAIVWAQEAKAMLARGVEAEKALTETAWLTWIPRSAGRDHTGMVDQGKALGLKDVIRDAVANASQGRMT